MNVQHVWNFCMIWVFRAPALPCHGITIMNKKRKTTCVKAVSFLVLDWGEWLLLVYCIARYPPVVSKRWAEVALSWSGILGYPPYCFACLFGALSWRAILLHFSFSLFRLWDRGENFKYPIMSPFTRWQMGAILWSCVGNQAQTIFKVGGYQRCSLSGGNVNFSLLERCFSF